ncbi:hypothetical protein SESBI_09829 [Sesbania bispinosa]|nr:hypothetical protein SESBI_09829 [Sesbania bispinosa]
MREYNGGIRRLPEQAEKRFAKERKWRLKEIRVHRYTVTQHSTLTPSFLLYCDYPN